jgi:hypothetical protein
VRAICEACVAAQPVDWKPGDHCVACGAVARREKRCHWCTKWTPDGKFCRHCGSGLVADEQYGAARMLQRGGVDQFSLPERLAALTPDHVEHFTRLYQRHVAVVSRLVDDLRFVEGHLRQQAWSDRLDDELTAQLPWDDDTLAWWTDALPKPGTAPTDDGERLAQLCAASPNSDIATLAGLAILRSGRLRNADQADTARRALHSDDQAMLDEGALAFGHWRTRFLPVGVARTNEIRDALDRCSMREPATIAIALLEDETQLPAELLATPDPDDAFATALVIGDADRLRASLREPDRTYPAARALARHGHGALLAETLSDPGALDDDQLDTVLATIEHRSTAGTVSIPALHDVLLDVAGRTGEGRVRRAAARIVARENRAEDGARLIAIDPEESDLVRIVLQEMQLPQPEIQAIARDLVRRSRFRSSQYGVDDLADSGRVSDGFVPSVWPTVTDEEQQRNLFRFAERQLQARGDDGLHRFMLSIVYGDRSAAVRNEAWWSLRRWYPSYGDGREGPLVFEADAMRTWFGSVAGFLERLGAFLRNPEGSGENALQEQVAYIIRYTDTAKITTVIEADPDAFARFFAEFDAVIAPTYAHDQLRSAVITFCYWLGFNPAWYDATLAVLDRHGDDGQGYEAKSTAERIRANVALQSRS